MYNISNRRECFFDDTLINTARTTAEFLLHHPIRKGIVCEHNAPWELSNCGYHHFFYDNGIYRMYYRNTTEKIGGVVCYMESKDGINWYKPELHICEYDGSDNNNIILDVSSFFNDSADNFTVFKDENPLCPPEEKYKAIAGITINKVVGLHYYVSPDAIHFSYGGLITENGQFDSLNVAFYDTNASIYRCYFRNFHNPYTKEDAGWGEDALRDIRYMESPDFKSWSEPHLLDFGDSEDVALYTSMIQMYPRADHILVGFPTRYLYRRNWTGNYDELCGREERLERMENESPRAGLVVTDSTFITSRDGIHFKKYDEAFFRNEPEYPYNWTYGDGYPALGMFESKSDIEGADPELSLLYWERHHTKQPNLLTRYTIRCDGFVSLHSGAVEKMIVTKKFIYNGSDLFINFATSALGYMYFTLIDDDGNRYESCETFGNKIDRRVIFDDNIVKNLSGKPVTLEVRMRDADLYSIIFK